MGQTGALTTDALAIRQMGYILRSAEDSDKSWLEQLRRLVYHDLFHATWGQWDEDRHQRQFSECWHRGEICLVEIDGHPVGMLQLFESNEILEVVEIQIRPEHQGIGIGTRLLCDVIDQARERGKDVVLSTGLMNLRATRLYEHLGFQETKRSDTHIHFAYCTEAR